jgi:hypothetical protein
MWDSALLDEKLDTIQMTFAGGQVQRGSAVIVWQSHVHATQTMPKITEAWQRAERADQNTSWRKYGIRLGSTRILYSFYQSFDNHSLIIILYENNISIFSMGKYLIAPVPESSLHRKVIVLLVKYFYVIFTGSANPCAFSKLGKILSVIIITDMLCDVTPPSYISCCDLRARTLSGTGILLG